MSLRLYLYPSLYPLCVFLPHSLCTPTHPDAINTSTLHLVVRVHQTLLVLVFCLRLGHCPAGPHRLPDRAHPTTTPNPALSIFTHLYSSLLVFTLSISDLAPAHCPEYSILSFIYRTLSLALPRLPLQQTQVLPYSVATVAVTLSPQK